MADILYILRSEVADGSVKTQEATLSRLIEKPVSRVEFIDLYKKAVGRGTWQVASSIMSSFSQL